MKFGKLLAIAGATIVFEVALRLVGFGHPLLYEKQGLGYELRPSQTSSRLGHTTHINSMGLRGPETSPAPHPGTMRIMTLGDSVANGGSQISDSQTLEFDLEKDLGPGFEVLNASSGGWSVMNERDWLLSHGDFGSKFLILVVNRDDLSQSYAKSSILDHNVSFPSRYPLSAICELVSRYVMPHLGLANSADPGSTGAGKSKANLPAVLSAVSDIKQWADDHGVKMAILYWPRNRPPDADEVFEQAALFERAKVKHIEIINAREAVTDPKPVYRDQVHPTAYGNKLIADFAAIRLKPALTLLRNQGYWPLL